MTDFFNSYIVSILSMGITVFICEFICNTGKGSKSIAKAVSFIAGLCLFITVILPFFSKISSLLDKFYTLSNTVEQACSSPQDNQLYNLAQTDIAESIKELIYSEFGIKPVNAIIELHEKDGLIYISHASVTLKNENKDILQDVEHFLTKNGFENPVINIEETNNESN